jgi:hypothetical protein
MNKPKFNPIVTRVKLNPEQAVLACSCYTTNRKCPANGTGGRVANRSICQTNVCINNYCLNGNSANRSST